MKRDPLCRYRQLAERETFSANALDSIRSSLAASLEGKNWSSDFSIVVTGSFGRKEASAESDMDAFILSDAGLEESEIKAVSGHYNEAVYRHVDRPPGSSGTFDITVQETVPEMIRNIGGDQDDNRKLTRRLLFLLEGDWLYGQEKFERYRRQLVETYIKPEIPSEHLVRFLLNDVIRYYRTITTDFEQKVAEDGKSWGLRKVKLRFSRKLLYFSGIITVAETPGIPHRNKIQCVLDLLSLPPLRRIVELSSEEPEDILQRYEDFLTRISDPEVREKLNRLNREHREKSPLYVELRAEGEQFSHSLASWLKREYREDHPIHHALLF